jgi:hypothetical protein
VRLITETGVAKFLAVCGFGVFRIVSGIYGRDASRLSLLSSFSFPLFLRLRLPVQTVDATPLWSFDLATRFKRTGPLGCSSLLLKQDAFSSLLCSRMILSPWNS